MPRSNDLNKNKSYNKHKYINANHVSDIRTTSSHESLPLAEREYIQALHDHDITFEDLFTEYETEFLESDLDDLKFVRSETPITKEEIFLRCKQIRSQWSKEERYVRLSSSLRFKKIRHAPQKAIQTKKTIAYI